MTFYRPLGALLGLGMVAGAAIANPMAINVNEADSERLQQISGIGPATAQAIIDDREQNGPFDRIEAMTRVDGIGEATLEGLRDAVTID
jgi:competence protein ComEA